jgi:hypothetical protein
LQNHSKKKTRALFSVTEQPYRLRFLHQLATKVPVFKESYSIPNCFSAAADSGYLAQKPVAEFKNLPNNVAKL